MKRPLLVTIILVVVAACLISVILVRHARQMLEAENEVYAMHVAPQILINYLHLTSGTWPKSWSELQAATEPEVVAFGRKVNFVKIRKHVTIDFSLTSCEVLSELNRGASPIVPRDAVYDYADDYNMKELERTLQIYCPADLKRTVTEPSTGEVEK